MTGLSTDIPVIETGRLILRGWREADLDGLAALFADERATRFTGGTRDRSQSWRQLATYAGHWALKGFGPFAVVRKEDAAVMGYAGPWDPAEKADEPEITYGLAASYHGQGYASEAVGGCVAFAYRALKWPTAVSFIDKDNTASLGVVRKLGASHDGDTRLYGSVPVQVWRYPAPEDFLETHASTSLN